MRHLRAECKMRSARRLQRGTALILLGLDHIPPEATTAARAPLGLSLVRQLGTLTASKGVVRYGNPQFQSATNTLPKFATRRVYRRVAGHENLNAHEPFIFTIAGNPGLIEDTSDNVGHGESFAVYGTPAHNHLRPFWPRILGRASHALGRSGKL